MFRQRRRLIKQQITDVEDSNQTQDTDAESTQGKDCNDAVIEQEQVTEDVCAICMECIDTSKSITVVCGDKIHKSCVYFIDVIKIFV